MGRSSVGIDPPPAPPTRGRGESKRKLSRWGTPPLPRQGGCALCTPAYGSEEGDWWGTPQPCEEAVPLATRLMRRGLGFMGMKILPETHDGGRRVCYTEWPQCAGPGAKAAQIESPG